MKDLKLEGLDCIHNYLYWRSRIEFEVNVCCKILNSVDALEDTRNRPYRNAVGIVDKDIEAFAKSLLPLNHAACENKAFQSAFWSAISAKNMNLKFEERLDDIIKILQQIHSDANQSK